MKWFVIVALIGLNCQARTQELLKCLGAEEKHFHEKKDLGPSYELNQRLISEIIQIPNISIQEDAVKEICRASNQASWKLLQLSLIKKKAIFVNTATGMQTQVTAGMIDDYIAAADEILLSTIASIQAKSPTPTCLEDEVPMLKDFFIQLKYLQEEVDTEKLFAGKDEKIFEAIRNYPAIIKKCQARLKKKLKSESKAAAKKP